MPAIIVTVCVSDRVIAFIGPNAHGCAEVFQRPGDAEFFEETKRLVSAHSISESVGGGFRIVCEDASILAIAA